MNVGLGFGVRKSGFHVDRRQVFSQLRPFWRRLSWQLNIGRSRRKRISPWSLDMGFCLLDYNKLPLRSCRNPHFGKISRKGTCRVSGTAVSENKAWRNAEKNKLKQHLRKFCLTFEGSLVLREAQNYLLLSRQIQVGWWVRRIQNCLKNL